MTSDEILLPKVTGGICCYGWGRSGHNPKNIASPKQIDGAPIYEGCIASTHVVIFHDLNFARWCRLCTLNSHIELDDNHMIFGNPIGFRSTWI